MSTPSGIESDGRAPEGEAALRRLAAAGRFHVRALLIGQRLAIREAPFPRVASAPEVVCIGPAGLAVLFRYGVAVLFHEGQASDPTVIEALRALSVSPFDVPEEEDAEMVVAPTEQEHGADGVVHLRGVSLERLQVVADVMAKTVVLAQYEGVLQGVFDRVEPLAESIGRGRPGRRQLASILEHLGATLLAETKTVGRVQVTEKPDLVWDDPQLDRLWGRLAEEYELGERQAALERRLDVINRTAQTALELLHAKRSLRVEWYIVILIVVEILLSVYELFWR